MPFLRATNVSVEYNSISSSSYTGMNRSSKLLLVTAAVIMVVVVEETQCRNVTSGLCCGGRTRSNSIICYHTIVTLIVYIAEKVVVPL